jgi:hypothetical protein
MFLRSQMAQVLWPPQGKGGDKAILVKRTQPALMPAAKLAIVTP